MSVLELKRREGEADSERARKMAELFKKKFLFTTSFFFKNIFLSVLLLSEKERASTVVQES